IEFEPFYSSQLMNSVNIFKKVSNLLKSIFVDIDLFKASVKRLVNRIFDKLSLNSKYRFSVLTKFSYSDVSNTSMTHIPASDKNIPGVFPDWDNTPRRGENAM